MDAMDYGGVAGIVLGLQALAETIRVGVAKIVKKREEDATRALEKEATAARQRVLDVVADLKLEDVKHGARLDALGVETAGLLTRFDKIENRMDLRDEQVRQGLDNATKTLHHLALQIARGRD